MKTFIVTAHEEEYSNKSRTLGVLLNFDENYKRVDSLIYIYREGMYIFFNTIMEMNDYLLYGEGRLKRAYLSEKDFDVIYDAPYINGKFGEQLTWTQ
jgi:hypothetical protein